MRKILKRISAIFSSALVMVTSVIAVPTQKLSASNGYVGDIGGSGAGGHLELGMANGSPQREYFEIHNGKPIQPLETPAKQQGTKSKSYVTYGHWGLNWMTTGKNRFIAYCIEPTTPRYRGRESDAYIDKGDYWGKLPYKTQKQLWLAQYYGYGYGGLTNKPHKNPDLAGVSLVDWIRYHAAQTVIWEVVPSKYTHKPSDYPLYSGPFKDEYFTVLWRPNEPNDPEEIINDKAIVAKAKEIRSLVDAATPDPSVVGKTYGGGKNQIITINENSANLDLYRVEVGKGVQLVSKTRNQIKLKITSDQYDPNVYLRFKADNNPVIKQNHSYTWIRGTYQPMMTPGKDGPLQFRFKVNLESGDLELNKTAAGKPVSGVEFEFSYNSNMSNPFATRKTDSNGNIKLKDIDIGKVYYREKSVPSPVIIDRTIKSVTINAGKTSNVKVDNKIAKGRVRVNKKGPDGEAIQGAKFGVYQGSKLVDEIVTNGSGVAESKVLPLGSYTVKELFAPEPYLLNKETFPVSLNYKDQVTEIVVASQNVKNEKAKGRINITKVDTKGNKIKGAKFGIYKNDRLIEEVTTDENGKASSSKLDFGTYQVLEHYVPFPYLLNEKIFDVNLKYKDQHTPLIEVGLTVEDEIARGVIDIHKRESEEDNPEFIDQPLGGAEFEIRAAENIFEVGELIYGEGDVVQVLTTDKEGNATSKEIPFGKYHVQEIKPPVGYRLDPTEHTVEVKYVDNLTPVTTTSMTLKNKVIWGQFEILKYARSQASDTDRLAGVKFGVYRESDDKLMQELVTGRDGLVRSDRFRYGRYYVQEISAPEGYWIDKNKYPLSITDHQEVVQKTVSNDFVESQLHVFKVDSDSKRPLKGVEFKLMNDKGEFIFLEREENGIIIKEETWVTDEDGMAYITTAIPYGSYFLVETKPLPGYQPIEPIPFTIDKNQKYIDLEIGGRKLDMTVGNNLNRAPIKAKKIDADTKKPLEGVTFELYDSTMDLLTTKTTNEDGIAHFGTYTYGKYFVKEVETPGNFVIDPEQQIQEAFVDEHGVEVVVEYENKETHIEIEKIDRDTKKPVPNTVFHIYDENGLLVEKLKTDENGKARLDKVDYGKYTVEEVEVPFPYILDPETAVQEIEIGNEKPRHSLVFENVITTVNIFKRDKIDGSPIGNTVFEIYDENDKLLHEVVTDESGVATVEGLDFGKYKVFEVEVPFPYVINPKNNMQEFVFSRENNSYDIEFENVATKVEVLKVDKFTGEPIPETKFEMYGPDGEFMDTFITDKNGSFSIEGLELGKYAFVEVDVPFPYVIDPNDNIKSVEITEDTNEVKLAFENVDTEVAILKVDAETLQPVPNTEFEISTEDGRVIEKLKTDKDGKASVKGLELGNYTITETNVPEPYVIDPNDNSQDFSLTSAKPKADIDFENVITKINIFKRDKIDGSPIPNTKFEIYDMDDNLLHEVTTGETGVVTVEGLEFGEYKVFEVEVPHPYVINPQNKMQEFVLDFENNSYDIVFENVTTQAVIYKRDKIDGSPIPNTTFEIYDMDENLLHTVVTDEEGLAVVEGLEFGEYKVFEVDVPFPYVINPKNKMQEFVLSEENNSYDIVFENVAPEIKIFKRDKIDGSPIPNTTFEIYDIDENLLHEVVTNDEGYAVVEGLEFGEYKVFEVDVPFPYIINPNNKFQEFIVDEDNFSYDIVFENVKTKVNIYKRDKIDGSPIPNTTFEIYDMDENLLHTVVTDDEGMATVEGLEFGEYKVFEVDVPAPYIINPNNKFQEFVFDEENNSYDIVFKNEKATGLVEINKTDSEDGSPLSDVEFGIWKVEEDETVDAVLKQEPLETGLTDKDGKLVFEELELGDYVIQELKAKPGYDLNDKVFEVSFEFKDEETPVIEKSIDVTNDRSIVELQVKKIDADTKKAIHSDDVEFGLYDSNKKLITTVKGNDKAGISRFNLSFGTYYVKELKAPKGYKLSSKFIKVKVDGTEKPGDLVIEVENKIIPKVVTGVDGISNPVKLGSIVGSLSLLGLAAVMTKRKKDEDEE